jgi:hypothetical protein
VALQTLPVRQFVFRLNSNNSVINSAKHNFVYLTTEHIRYLVSNQGSPVKPVEIILRFVPLSSLTVPIPVVLFVTISVTATVSL